MGQRILVFEKNADFLRELEAGFSRHDAHVVRTRDVEQAVDQARRGEVDLVLVTAEALSAPGEVFLICKRFKSEDDLARIPFVVLGGPANSESFEQHKKLKKRRADEYVELPVTFDALWAKVRPLVSWGRISSEGGEAHVPSRIDVDADIDAFAESAFGDLVRPDSVRPPAVSHAQSATTQGSSFERNRLETLVEELTSRAEAAEERVGQAERKLKAAEANRPSVHPTPTAVSSRDYLELREQLNRKDKELLSLRDEITSRDRRLLEASDRALVLERTQAELHDNITELTSRFEDALAKVGQYEADIETARKRAEGLTTRLSRAEDNGRALERELDATRQAHATELSERKAAHEQQVRGIEAQNTADTERLRGEHADEVQGLRSAHAGATADLEARSASALADLQSRSDALLAQARAAHQNEVSALGAAHAQAVQSAAHEAAQRRDEEQRAHEEALAAAAASSAAFLESVRAEHAAELANTRAQLEQQARDSLLARENELAAQHAGVLQERDDKHSRELAAVGRRLAESDAKGAQLAAKLADTEQAKQDLETRLRGEVRNLEGHLSARTEERDLTQNELASARAQLASLEQLALQRADRISQLENALGAAEQRIGSQNAKIAADNELLERVRRALGIGMGLLEQQKQNVVEGA